MIEFGIKRLSRYSPGSLAAVLCLSSDEGIALTEHLRGHHALRAYLALCESDTGNAPAGFYPG